LDSKVRLVQLIGERKGQQVSETRPKLYILTDDQKARENNLMGDLHDSPVSKSKYKNISKDVKEMEKVGSADFSNIVTSAFKFLKSIPQKIHWRVYLELADIAKRESKFADARHFFKLVVSVQPYAYQGWLEYSKMEEECGNYEQAKAIIHMGLKLNPLNENLFIKAVKLEEKAQEGS